MILTMHRTRMPTAVRGTPLCRYGNLKGGARDIKQHPWFSGVDFDAIIKRTKPGPIVITAKSEDDTSNFDDYSDVGPIEHEFVLTADNQQLFEDF